MNVVFLALIDKEENRKHHESLAKAKCMATDIIRDSALSCKIYAKFTFVYIPAIYFKYVYL